MKKTTLALAICALTGASTAFAATCPSFGDDTDCGVILTINPDLSVTITNPVGQGPYDGAEDTLVGVVNSSAIVVNSLNLSSTTDIFGFDGDGIDTFGAPGNASDTTGYGGPITFFTGIDALNENGTANFLGGLAVGATTYFSLEENLSSADSGLGGSVGGSAPEPAGVALAGLGLLALLAARRKG